MSKPKGYERSRAWGGDYNPLDDRLPAETGGHTQSVLINNSDLKKLQNAGGKGILKKYFGGNPPQIGDIIELHTENLIFQARVLNIQITKGKKADTIEVKIIKKVL